MVWFVHTAAAANQLHPVIGGRVVPGLSLCWLGLLVVDAAEDGVSPAGLVTDRTRKPTAYGQFCGLFCVKEECELLGSGCCTRSLGLGFPL